MTEMTPLSLQPPSGAPFDLALAALRAGGHAVEPQDIPGLYRIDGGPELTTGQVIHVAQQMGLLDHA